MMSPLVQQHFHEPKYVGELAKAANVLRVDVDSPSTGRHVIFSIAVDNDIISDVRFRVRGCPYTIATFSWVADWCTGKQMSLLAKLSREMIVQALQLPANKVHCAAMAEDMLRQLLQQWEPR